MYKCNECNEIFPKVGRDESLVRHIGYINLPVIDMCPKCRSIDITRYGFIQPSISLSH